MSIKKFFACALLLGSNSMYGQWTDGDTIPDFILRDLEGKQHNMDSILEEGKIIFFDFFFPACTYCWNDGVKHQIKDLTSAYGENGSNQMSVFGINVWGDGIGTYMGDLAVPNINGVDISSQNFVRGDFEYTGNYPIIPQGSAFGDTMQIVGCPTYMLACPNKRVYDSYYPWLVSDAQSKCGVSLTKVQNNVRIYVPELSTCAGFNRVNVYGQIRNTGSNNITSVRLKLMVNNTLISTQDLTYSGTNNTDATMGLTEFKFDNVLIDIPLGEYGKGPYKLVVDMINGVTLSTPIEKIIKITKTTTSTNFTDLNVELKSDMNAAELSWSIYNSNGTIVAQNPTILNNTIVSTPVSLANIECYTFRLQDIGGNGGGNYGDDSRLRALTPSNTELCDLTQTPFGHYVFGYDAFHSIRVGSLSLESADLVKLSIHPNPVKDVFTIETTEKVSVEICDINGKLLRTIYNVDQTSAVNISDLASGIYLINIKSDTASQLVKVVKD
jgi:hypothetical protein